MQLFVSVACFAIEKKTAEYTIISFEFCSVRSKMRIKRASRLYILLRELSYIPTNYFLLSIIISHVVVYS